MRVLRISFLFLGLMSFFSWPGQSQQPAPEPDFFQALKIGEELTFYSNILNEDRQLNVYLPPSYHPDSIWKYPVLYVLDGGMDQDFMHIAGLTQFASFSWIGSIPEMVVVGIVNTDRTRDFTFPSNNTEDQTHAPTHGGSAAFMNAFKKEIIPLIDARYKTSDDRTLVGQSLGGLVATQILYEHTDLFNRYIIVSPSLWWDDESYLKKELPDLSSVDGIFITSGKEHPDMIHEAKELYDLIKANVSEGAYSSRAVYHYLPNRDHGDVLHEAVMLAFEKMNFWGNQQPVHE